MPATTDRIEKQIDLQAAPERVWRALADTKQFGAWFGIVFEGAFAPGARLTGKITSPGYEHLTCDIVVERMEPERVFAYRWHPYAVDPNVDYSSEPMTLVEFTMEAIDSGTRLFIVESGFDAIPAARRAEAFRMNDGGWAQQLQNIERHVTA